MGTRACCLALEEHQAAGELFSQTLGEALNKSRLRPFPGSFVLNSENDRSG
jgi:hypothetical protein